MLHSSISRTKQSKQQLATDVIIGTYAKTSASKVKLCPVCSQDEKEKHHWCPLVVCDPPFGQQGGAPWCWDRRDGPQPCQLGWRPLSGPQRGLHASASGDSPAPDSSSLTPASAFLLKGPKFCHWKLPLRETLTLLPYLPKRFRQRNVLPEGDLRLFALA